MKILRFAAWAAASLCFMPTVYGQNSNKGVAMPDCPMQKEHLSPDSHRAAVEQHGDKAMGFSRRKTTHHFRVLPDGGAIEVAANDVGDKVSTEAIRSHLSHIAAMFAQGDFSAPTFVHHGVPPGVTTMQLLKDKIQYRFEPLPSGGRVLIESNDQLALAGIHDFLRFQISEHQTGDALEIPSSH